MKYWRPKYADLYSQYCLEFIPQIQATTFAEVVLGPISRALAVPLEHNSRPTILFNLNAALRELRVLLSSLLINWSTKEFQAAPVIPGLKSQP